MPHATALDLYKRLLAVGASEGRVTLHDAEQLESAPPLLSFDAGGPVVGVGIHGKGRRLIVCTHLGLKLFTLGFSPSAAGNAPGPDDMGLLNMTLIEAVVFEQNATVVAFTSSDDAAAVALVLASKPMQRTMLCYKATRHELTPVASKSTALQIGALALPEQGECLFVGSTAKDGSANMHFMKDFAQKAATKLSKAASGLKARVTTATWLPNQRHIVSGHANGALVLADTQQIDKAGVLTKDVDAAISSLYCGDNHSLLVGTAEGQVLVYQLHEKNTGLHLVRTLSVAAKGATSPILSMALYLRDVAFAACSSKDSERPISIMAPFASDDVQESNVTTAKAKVGSRRPSNAHEKQGKENGAPTEMNFQTQMETVEDSEESDAESAASVDSQVNIAAVEQDDEVEVDAPDKGKARLVNDAQSDEEEEEDDDTVIAIGGNASSSSSSSPATDKRAGRGDRATQEIRLGDLDAIAKKPENAAAAKGVRKSTLVTQQSDAADSQLGSAAVVPSSNGAGKISKSSDSASRQGLKGMAAAKRLTNADQPDEDIGILLDIGALSSSSDEEHHREESDDDYVPPGSQAVSKAKRGSSTTPHLSPKRATQKKPAPAAASDDMLVIGARDAAPASSPDEESDVEQAADSDVSSEDIEIKTRKRQAPSYHRLTSGSDSEEEEKKEEETTKAKGRRGAPRKISRLDAAAAAGASSPPLLAKVSHPGPRGKGRPRGSVGFKKTATVTLAAAAAAALAAAKSTGRGDAAAQASGSLSTLESQANDMAEAPRGTRGGHARTSNIVSESEEDEQHLPRREAADKATDRREGATSPPLLAGVARAAASSAYSARKRSLAEASPGSEQSLGESLPSRKLSKTEAALSQLRHNRALWDLKFTSQVERWPASAVAKWLRENGFESAASQASAAGVDGELFLEIEEDMLSDLGISSALQRRRFDVLRRRLCASGPS